MDLPFDYVIFYLMSILNSRNMELKINKKKLPFIFKNLINLLPYDEEEKTELYEQFNFNFEFNSFINLYSEYLDIDDDCLVFDYDYNVLNGLLNSIKYDYSDYILDDISSTIDNNFVFLDLLGVKIKKNMYHNLLEIENEVEIMYDSLYQRHDDKDFMREFKSLILKRKMFLNIIENNLNTDDYYDLYIYASNMAVSNDEDFPIEFEFQEDTFDENELIENPMLKAIFYKDKLAFYNIAKRMDINISKKSGLYESNEFPEKRFYLNFLRFLDEEISNTDEKQLVHEFVTSKYRLMNALDAIFDTYTFIDDIDYVNVNKENNDCDYSFAEDKVFYFINEILQYDDDKYEYNDKEFYNLLNYYFNIIKKLFIKTYYCLTDDDRVVEMIKSNSLYGVNKISTRLLDSAIDKLKPKTKIK